MTTEYDFILFITRFQSKYNLSPERIVGTILTMLANHINQDLFGGNGQIVINQINDGLSITWMGPQDMLEYKRVTFALHEMEVAFIMMA